MSNPKDDESGMTTADPLAVTLAAASGSGPRPALGFAEGTMIADRYRIVGLLGRGGMGEVYRAEDKLLGVEVALKTIRANQAGGDAAVARFRREIQLARRITHSNVSRIFDVGIHGDTVFLTMELLEGETVSARIKRAGRLPVAEARTIVDQVCAALGAAHAQGVVHRDLTSHNIILTRDGRAVVTDFGLARSANDSDATVTSDGEMIGSPAYMSPEQVEGTRAFTPATDIYALGVVMFEMVTGRLPFVGETSMATAVMRIRETPPSPRDFSPDLPPPWEQVILKCLERSAAARFQSARQVVDALAVRATASRWRPLALAIGIAVIAVAGITFLRASVRPRGPAPAAASVRPSVAIFGFANLSARKEDEYLAAAISEMLSTEMTAGEVVRASPAESVARARRELDIPSATSFSPETLTRIRRLLNTDYVVVGSYVVMSDGARVRVDCKLQDTRTGDTVSSIAENGSQDDLAGLVGAIGARLRARLGVRELSPSERAGARASLPASSTAAALYAEGVEHLRVHNCGAARAPLDKAVALEPRFALARAQLAFTLWCLGYDKQAADEGKRAVELAANLPEEARYFIEARLAETTGDAARAERIYQQLFDRFPDNFDYGMRLAELQGRTGSPRARPTLERLRKLPPPDRDNARIDVLEAALEAPDLEKMLGALEKAQTKAEAHGARLVAAEAMLGRARLVRALGRYDEALTLSERGKEIYQSSGDVDGTLLAMAEIVASQQLRGDTESVRRIRAEAKQLREGMEVSRAYVTFATGLAGILAAQGDIDGAIQDIDEVQQWSASRGNGKDEARSLYVRASFQQLKGDLKGAEESLVRALALLRETHERGVGQFHVLLAVNSCLRGEFKAAATSLDQAIEAEPKIAASGAADMVKALIAFGEGKLPQAEAAARSAIAGFEKTAPINNLWASVLLVQLLLEEGEMDEARMQYERVKSSAKNVHHVAANALLYDTIEASMLAFSGHKEQQVGAEKLLADVIARATKFGFALQKIDAELLLGRLELMTGKLTAGRARLKRVIQEGEAIGCGLYIGLAKRALAHGGRY